MVDEQDKISEEDERTQILREIRELRGEIAKLNSVIVTFIFAITLAIIWPQFSFVVVLVGILLLLLIRRENLDI